MPVVGFGAVDEGAHEFGRQVGGAVEEAGASPTIAVFRSRKSKGGAFENPKIETKILTNIFKVVGGCWMRPERPVQPTPASPLFLNQLT